MNVQANVENMKYISQDFHEVSRQLGRMLTELEDVRRELAKQTEFSAQIRALRKAGSRLEEEEYKTGALAQALANIGNLYQKTERGIEECFESGKSLRSRQAADNVDLNRLSGKVNTILYGGENGWQR